MPYISEKRRHDMAIGLTVSTSGEMAYEIQQLFNQFLVDFGVEHRTIGECIAAVESAKADLIDQVLLPYEAKKRKENGTVWTI